MMAGVLSIEFLVHAWDYAAATGRSDAPDSLSDYVMGLAKKIITPEGRINVGFDDPVERARRRRRAGPVARLHRPQPSGLDALEVEVAVLSRSVSACLPFMMPMTVLSSIFLKWSCSGWPS